MLGVTKGGDFQLSRQPSFSIFFQDGADHGVPKVCNGKLTHGEVGPRGGGLVNITRPYASRFTIPLQTTQMGNGNPGTWSTMPRSPPENIKLCPSKRFLTGCWGTEFCWVAFRLRNTRTGFQMLILCGNVIPSPVVD